MNFSPKLKSSEKISKKKQKAAELASMGSRITLHSTGSNSDNIRAMPPGGVRTDMQRSQVVLNPAPTTGGGATKKKKTLHPSAALQRENSLQKQLSSNLIFQRQQQRLSSSSVDDPNEVPDSLTAIRVPVDPTASAASPVMTATLPRRSPPNQIVMNFTDLEPQTLTRSGASNRSRRNSSASSPPVMGQLRRSSCRLGRSCSRHSLCRSQNLSPNFENETDEEIVAEQKTKSKKDLAKPPINIYEEESAVSNAKETNFKKVLPTSNMSIVIFGENAPGSPTSWKSNVVLTSPPQETLSGVQDEFGFQRGVRTPDFVYMRVHPSCARKYIVPVENSGKTRLLEMKHILKQEMLAGDFGIFQNKQSMYYAFVRVRPPLDETFVVTSGDSCKEVAVFNGKAWEVVRTAKREPEK